LIVHPVRVEIPRSIQDDSREEAQKRLGKYRDIFLKIVDV